jgi:hypothetical protein
VSTIRPISEMQREANRRNASQSTGPKTEAAKQASRMNAVTHGLLAKAVVITAGDYQEDAQEFGQLLEDLREQFTPVGVAEDLEVQKIALCYWRKMRAVRYEHGAIRKQTGDMREREELSHEKSFDLALGCGSNLERTSRGIDYLIDTLEAVKQEALDGPVSDESQEWLEQQFADEFTPPDETLDYLTLLAEQTEGGPAVPEDERRQPVDTIDEQLRRLSRLREKVAAIEELNLDSKLRAAALPGPGAVDKQIRYETSNDRELDRTLKRLERMQERRCATGDSHPTN